MNDGSIVLRRAGPDDALCLGALATQVFYETYATSGIRAALVREAQAQFSPSAVGERLRRPGCLVTLAERRDHLVAFSEVELDARHERVPPGATAELARLYVQSPFVRQGVGRSLLANAEASALAAGAATLWLTAWVGNRRALAFYASQRYEDVGSSAYVFEGDVYENRVFVKALRAAD